MPALALTFFGVLQTKLDDQPIPHFRSANVQGLLIYLVLQAKRPFPRDSLATLFWPDMPDSTAKKNLRQTLYQLRQLLNDSDIQPQPFLLVTRSTIQFNPNSPFTLDVQTFSQGLADGDLETAVSLYQGELLPGFVCDSLEFEAWLRQERERLHRLALEAMSDLTERQLAQSELVAAQATARRQLALEPWREVAHRQLMHALALTGERSAALAQYQRCCELLDEELGVEPSTETAELAARIEANTLTTADPDLIAGRYKLGSQIGRGAMGIVYRGQDRRTKEPVAIKMLDRSRVAGSPDLVERFRREGEALRQLNHPNIVKLLAVAEKGEQQYLVMEYIEGGDLQQFLQEQPQPPLPQVLSIALDLADALTRAHRLDILHRDIKPANVLLDSTGVPRLTDFGVARLGEASQLTRHGAIIGTASYLSPEACKGEPLDERADIWAFGVLLYEMLCGKRPFARPTSASTMLAILQEAPPDISTLRPDLPTNLLILLDQMLTKNREDRIASVRLVGAALEALLREQDEPIAGSEPSTVPKAVVAPITRKPAAAAPTESTFIPFLAPPAPPHFVGRDGLIAEIRERITAVSHPSPILALVGMGGVGKTSLAAAIARQMRDQFADGVLWANVRHSGASNILELWGRAYGHDYSGLSDLNSRGTAVRGLLADKQTLIVLDNVDDAAAARPLLLNGPRCAVILTTRNQDIAAALNAHAVRVAELTPESSQALLVNILGEERVLAHAEETAAAAQIGDLLHHLPLAVEIAAQRLKSRPRMRLMAMARRLLDTQQRLGLEISDQAVRASFQVSWEALDAPLQYLFSCMAVFAGRPFTPAALAAAADRDLFDTEDDLYTLAALSLVQEVGETRTRQHPLLADFAAEKLEDREGVNGRLVAYYLTFAQENKEDPTALDPEWENLTVAVQAAYNYAQWQKVLDFTDVLAGAWMQYGRFHDANQIYAWAETAAAHLQSDEALAQTLLRWSEISIEQSNYNQAWEQLQTAQQLFYKLEDGSGIAKTNYFQGFILYDQGDYNQAVKLFLESQNLQALVGNRHEEATTTRLLARAYFEIDETTSRAEKTAQKALAIRTEIGNELELIPIFRLLSEIEIRKNNLEMAEQYAAKAVDLGKKAKIPAEIGAANYLLTTIHILRGNYDIAENLAKESLTLFRQLGNKRYEAMIMQNVSALYLRTDDFLKAKEIIEEALKIYKQIEDRLGYGYSLRQLGDIYLKLNQLQKCNAAWEEAKKIAEFLNHNHLLTQIYQRMNIESN